MQYLVPTWWPKSRNKSHSKVTPPSRKTLFIQPVNSPWNNKNTPAQSWMKHNSDSSTSLRNRIEKLQWKNAALELAAHKGGTRTPLDNITEIGSTTQQMWNPDLNYVGSEMQRGYRRHLPNTHSSTYFCFWAQIFLFDALQALKPPLWHHLEYLFNYCVGHKKETLVSWVKKFTFFFPEKIWKDAWNMVEREEKRCLNKAARNSSR